MWGAALVLMDAGDGPAANNLSCHTTDVGKSLARAERQLVLITQYQVAGIVVDTKSFLGLSIVKVLREARKLIEEAF